MNRLTVPLRVAVLVLLAAGIGLAQSPEISFLNPSTVSAGYPTFALRVVGDGYFMGQPPFSGSFVRWQRSAGGQAVTLPTTFVDATELIATVDSSLVSTPGVISIQVENRPGNATPAFSNIVSFVVTEGLTITTPPTLPTGTTGVPYSTSLAVSGGTAPYFWSFFEGQIPSGLVLTPNGTISGTPTTPGKFSAQIGVADSSQLTANRVFTIEILSGPLTILTESPLPSAELNGFYDQALNASGGVPPYVWELVGGTIPPGVGLFSDGVLSGFPSSAGVFTFTLEVSDQAEGSLRKEFQLEVIGPLAIATTSPLPEGTVGVAYNLALEATGGRPPYFWARASGALPTGLILGSDGVITGTPTSSGSYTFTAGVIDQREDVARRQFTMLVGVDEPPLSITTPPQLPDATAGAPYNTTLRASNGDPPYRWFVEEGQLPAGLALDSASGVISGTPTQTGDASFQIAVTDTAENSDSQVFRLSVRPPRLAITTPSPLPGGTVGMAYSTTLAATGGAPPYTWSQLGGTMPPGLALSSNGVLSGTPTTDGAFTFGVRVADSGEVFADRNFQITIARGAITISTQPILPPGALGETYSVTLAATGGIPPYTWSHVLGDLPPGVELSSAGEITGIPTESGDFGFRVRATDSAGGTSEKNFAIRIAGVPLPEISVGGLPEQTNPTDPQSLQVSITEPYPADLTGMATLDFAPDATEPADDPAVQFATGGRSVQFAIPAGSTAAMFGSDSSLGVQTGSVAGVITTNTVIGSGEGAARASQQMRVQRTVPSISVTAARTGGGFEVRVTGFSSPRDMTSARFQFSAAAGSNLRTGEATVQLADVFGGWYRNDDSDQYGSTFTYTQPFTIQGDTNAVTGVTVTLTNSVGASEPVTANF